MKLCDKLYAYSDRRAKWAHSHPTPRNQTNLYALLYLPQWIPLEYLLDEMAAPKPFWV